MILDEKRCVSLISIYMHRKERGGGMEVRFCLLVLLLGLSFSNGGILSSGPHMHPDVTHAIVTFGVSLISIYMCRKEQGGMEEMFYYFGNEL